MKSHLLVLYLIVFSIFQTSAFADGDPAKGKTIYATCIACHGQNGEGLQATNSPRLAGLHDWYLVSQLTKFRSGLRGANSEDIYGSQMTVFAKTLANEQAILDVVAYIGTLTSSHPARTELSGDPARGARLYSDEIRCSQCHGSTGQGLKQPYGKGSGAPRLAGQHDWYIIRQLQNFKAGVRGDPKDKFAMEMRVKAKIGISGDKDIKDLAAYLSDIE